MLDYAAARRPNLSSAFIADAEHRWGLAFVPDGTGDLVSTFGPEDVFYYLYAVLNAPAYRQRYGELLKGDFPRIPLVSDADVFRRLCGVGKNLVALHLLDAVVIPTLSKLVTSYPVTGTDRVDKSHPRYDEQHERVYISADDPKVKKQGQYFEGVSPEVWNFEIGGYQVLHKWLKDRQGRQLTYDDLTHYQQMVVAIKETIRLMAEIDDAIPGWPIT